MSDLEDANSDSDVPTTLLAPSRDKPDRPGRNPVDRSAKAGARAGMASKPGPHVLLYGGFGIGNTGNDATLEVTLAGLKERLPGARFTIVTTAPEVVTAEFGAPAVATQARARPSPGWPKPVSGLANEIRHWSQIRKLMRTADCLVVPGTGVFDDLLVAVRQHAYPMWMWCSAARQAGVKVMFVSIGAGPVERAWSRRFFGWTAAMASFRSYRDKTSKAFVHDVLGVDTSRDPVTPDLVFGLDVAPPPLGAGEKRTIGIGVMDYHTWGGRKGSADDIYDAYMEKLSAFCARLLHTGHAVHILVGDVGDMPAANDLRDRLFKAAPDRQADVTTAEIRTLRDLCAEVGKTDAVVATRYHTVMSALICGRPAISLGYAEKNRAVMADFGLGAYCQNIWDFDVAKLHTQLSEIMRDLPAAGDTLRRMGVRMREAVSQHLDEIAATIGDL